MKKFITLIALSFLLLVGCAGSRHFNIKDVESGFVNTTKEDIKYYDLKEKKDTTTFIVLSDDYDKKKPVLIFLQGSLPVPLLLKAYDENHQMVFSFLEKETVDTLKKEYHLVAISMPTVPLIVNMENVDDRIAYVKEKEPESVFDPAYHEANVLANYVRRTKGVIDFLSKQQWVDKSHISLFGHSQGAKVAIVTAVDNKKVRKVGFSGGNPFGRTDHTIREYRYDAIQGRATHEQVQHAVDYFYKAWEDMTANPNAKETKYADANRTWLSFDEPLIPYFLKVKQPIYVCYGTMDPKSVMSDVLPFYFTTAKKKNLTMRPYPGLEHNYYKLDENFKSTDETLWNEVIMEFMRWDFE
ncbi:hypothetical protein ORI89_05515 [Sphingobacterium sp. UT-1RO-CII-1]|uniref:alpha/beta hydrolase family protein n=1 Tax=Sphingobacterium sp. UT-1RO-CII-1 TaxID=2995225 RepID=UPI00227A1098|nr:hypothetical protein [Sphingobacterium sp. UT-1RO-CII-1]MCY4779098.1 hypothetical protein [Sphingobacterium sp. UT-1RO-CII-1]